MLIDSDLLSERPGFHPVDLEVGSQDLVHVQWTGNDNTNNNGNNNGEGTNDEDRHNIVQLDNTGLDVPAPIDQANMFDVMWEWNPEATGTFAGPRNKQALAKQFALSKQTGCNANPNNDQQRTNCEKLNSAAATVNLGLLRFQQGSYNYMSSRNNNFSNRAQKAHLTVMANPTLPPGEPVAVVAEAVSTGDPEKAAVKVSWALPGSEVGYTGFDGKEYWGMEQQTAPIVDYTVEYSLEGGADGTWVSGGARARYSSAWTAAVSEVAQGVADVGASTFWATSERTMLTVPGRFTSSIKFDYFYLWSVRSARSGGARQL